jgi:hypothetical protein
MKWPTHRTELFMRGHVTKQDSAGDPGSDGASPYHRAVSRVASPVTSPAMELADQTDRRIMEAYVTKQGNAASPGSGGASPYLSPSSSTVSSSSWGFICINHDVWGTSLGRMTWKAPAQAELCRTCAPLTRFSQSPPGAKQATAENRLVPSASRDHRQSHHNFPPGK